MNIIQGDAHKELKKMQAESVDCVVTSPPYYALRDYGMEGQIGMEGSPEAYIDRLLEVFDEVQRVLKKTGTCWVNLGDTYGGSGKGYGDKKQDPKFGAGRSRTIRPSPNVRGKGQEGVERHAEGKSLLQIPSRFAIGMTERGWILRNELIWHKPNAMPQSMKDRFTVDFEKIYFFTKSRKYFFEQQLEALAPSTLPRYGRAVGATKYGEHPETGAGGALNQPRPNIKHTDKSMGTAGGGFVGHSGYFKKDGSPLFNPKGRNMRAVWRISTTSFKGAHFAVFPEKLAERPILAGCPIGGIVLDPFAGSGTTLAVAERLGRKGVGIELNPEYAGMAQHRGTQGQGRGLFEGLGEGVQRTFDKKQL